MLLVYGIERVQPDLFDTSFTLLSIIELTMLGIAVGGIICLVVIINAAIHNQLAYWLGGTGNFDNLTYAQSLALPLVVILVPLYGFPIFYVPLLNIVALKAVHALSWIKAAIPVLITTSLWISLVLWLN